MTKTVSFKTQSLYYAVGMFFYLGCQWLTSVLITRMSLAAGGILTLAIAVTNPFSAIALYSMRAYQVSDIDDRFSSGVYIASRLLTMGLAVILCTAYALWNRYDPLMFTCVLLYMGLRLCEAMADVFQGISHKGGRLDIVGRSFILRGILSTGGFFAVWAATQDMALSMLAMAGLSLAGVLLYDLPQSSRLASIRPVFDWQALWQLGLACLPLTINTFLISHTGALPSTTLEAYADKASIGIYGALSMPCTIIQMAGSFIFNPMIPRFAEMIKNRRKEPLQRQFLMSIGIILGLTLLCSLAAWLLGPWALTLVFNAEVASYAPLLPQLIMVSGLITLTWFFALFLIIVRSYSGLLITNAATLACTWVLCRHMIPAGGVASVPLAMGLGITCRAVLYAVFLFRSYRKTFHT